jgi:hypothetical protein
MITLKKDEKVSLAKPLMIVTTARWKDAPGGLMEFISGE